MEGEELSAEVLLGAAIKEVDTESFAPCVQSWLGACIGYDNIAMIAYYQERPPSILYLWSTEARAHQNLETDYVEGLYLLDPFYSLHQNAVKRGAYRLGDIAPDNFKRTRYFYDYYRNTTLVDEIVFVSYPATGVSVHVSIARDASSKKRFSNKESRLTQQLAPIVVALSESHWRHLESQGELDDRQITSNLIRTLKERHSISLSPRQGQVALQIMRGHSSKSIARQLEISPQTVKVFRKQLFRKCKIGSLAELFYLLVPLLGNDVTPDKPIRVIDP